MAPPVGMGPSGDMLPEAPPPAMPFSQTAGAPMPEPEVAQPEPTAPTPPFPVGPGERVKVSVSESGYAPPTYKPRDPMAPLQRAESEQRALGEAQAQGVERMGQLQADYDENVTKWALDQKQKLLDDAETDRAEVMVEFETERSKQMTRIQQTIAAIPSRDPKRWWKNMDNFQRSAAMMSASIDGYLNPGGANGAVEQANKMAEADAYAQMTDIDTAKAKVGYEASAYERLLGDHEFKRQAFMEAKAYRLESLAVATEQRGMTFKSPITQQLHANEANKIRMESQKVLNELATSMSARLDSAAQRALQERMQKRSMAFEAGQAERAAQAKAAAAALEGGLRDPTTGDFVTGRDGKVLQVTGTDTQKANFQTKMDSTFTLQDKMKRLEALKKSEGRIVGKGNIEWLNSEAEAKAAALHREILFNYAKSQSGLSYTDKQLEQMMISYPIGSLWQTGAEGVMKQFRDGATLELEHEVNGRTGGWPGLREALDKRTGPLDEAPPDKPASPQGLLEVRRGLESGAVAPGPDTIDKIGRDIDEVSKMASRGQQIVPDVPNEVALAEMIDQGTQMAAQLQEANRTVEALQVKNKVDKLRQAQAKAAQNQAESGYGPVVGQGTPTPPMRRRGEQTALPSAPIGMPTRPGLVTP